MIADTSDWDWLVRAAISAWVMPSAQSSRYTAPMSLRASAFHMSGRSHRTAQMYVAW